MGPNVFSLAFGKGGNYNLPMREFLFLLLVLGLFAIALVTGAFVLLILAAVIAVSALYIYIRQKITGESPSSFRIYTFRQRARRTDVTPPEINVIEAEFEEIDEKKR